MKSWRELGEVPDSDDESLGYSESLHDPLDQFPEVEVDKTRAEDTGSGTAKDADVWQFPSSSPEDRVSERPNEPSTAPPAPRGDSQDILPSAVGSVDENAATAPNRPPTVAEEAFLQDEISTGYVRVSTPDSLVSSPASLLSRTPTPPRSPPLPQSGPSPLPDRGTPAEDAGELSRQTAVRLQRTLRPRKPIQQHPYLLENAQYTKFMRSHGIKPVRVIQEPQLARRRPEEEDSQDEEYQAEESQNTNEEVPNGGSEESGPVLFDDDEDELALTPSLPKTSPGQHLRTSSQQTGVDQTDATSLSDDEDLPPVDKLRPLSTKRQRMLKRQRSRPLYSTKRKRPRVAPDSSQGSPRRATFIPPPSIWDLSSSPPEPHAPQELSQDLGRAAKSPVRRYPSTAPVLPGRPTSTAGQLGTGAADSPIMIDEDQAGNASDDDITSSGQSSESDSDIVRQISRKIRGVLPASWLRLDRQQAKPPARNVRRSPELSPSRVARRGVALPRQGSPKPSSTAPFALFDESEESDDSPTPTPIVAGDMTPDEPATIVIDDDDNDGDSVVEDDTIDWMLPGRKRSSSHHSFPRAKKRKQTGTHSIFSGQPGQRTRQPMITQAFRRSSDGANSISAKEGPARQRRRERGGSSSRRKSRKKASPPPLLSILDVMEPDAPRFIKIAARAVKRKANLGKTSPSKKLISLATRSDNIDALSTLRDWKTGKTKPRITLPSSRQPREPNSRPALLEVSANTAARRRPEQPPKLARQSRLDAFVTSESAQNSSTVESPSISRPHARNPLQDRRPTLRPAQLEVDESEDRRRQLHSRKRTLDAFYRRSRRLLDISADVGFDQPLDVDFTLRESAGQEGDNSTEIEEAPATTGENRRNLKSRFRKRRRPQQVDPDAPQYTRANDPLPADFTVVDVQEHHSQDKLKGLGPYGTHYTHHFEVFPLDRGTFFHESTFIGRGYVRDAVDAGLSDRARHQRPAASFSLDGQVLRWGAWDESTSSELGILIDWVSEQLVSGVAAEEAAGRKAIEAADFVVRYMLGSLSVEGNLEEKAFISRSLEVFASANSRFESVGWTALSEGAKRTHLEVATRFLVAIFIVRSLSHAWGSDPLQAMKVDDLLKKCASVTIERLLACGTAELRTLYGDLQRPSFRERGIRPDRLLANCWVVAIRVLESAAIPRSSFWDVTHSVMLRNGDASGSDVQAFERLWQDVFTLLPLCEMDISGILVSGMRHTAPVEGWALPQQLLRRVFELYRSNPRQPPGFNDYCRALVARCHFLVQQWGWRRCTGIIGTIFDFFGSQNLAHLRNEEVYKSPRFLEELDCSPSLSIEPEDRCFHIFIKLLALAIRRLRELGRFNDIKNLVARTLPNHNRQYLKEDTVHQQDLAALRNHHDLLCTLFWISPPDLRPAIHLIEKLIVPGSAHKEACLINVRAWNQLARFVISNGECGTAFKPLAAWRNNVFNQILDQYLSAASDIEQQFRALSSEMPGISKEVRDDMIAKNKATALDVLHFSVKASLDVLQRAPSLGAALYALNTSESDTIVRGVRIPNVWQPNFKRCSPLLTSSLPGLTGAFSAWLWRRSATFWTASIRSPRSNTRPASRMSLIPPNWKRLCWYALLCSSPRFQLICRLV